MFGYFLLFFLFISHPFSVEINKKNVFDIISHENDVFVHFWAEGCKHCMAFAPEWNELVRIYHNVEGVVLATINCDRCPSLCAAFDGTSTPGVQHFAPKERKGEQFGGERTVLALAKWVKKNSGKDPFTKPHSLLFVSPKEIEADIQENWILLTIDNPRKQSYNHTEIRKCEEVRDDVLVRALSNKHFPKEAENFCNGKEHCIVLTNGKDKFEYQGEIESRLLLDFIDFHFPESDL